MEKVNKVCKAILALSDKDIEDALTESNAQADYCHPLKCEKQQRLNALGDYNITVIRAIIAAREILKNPPAFIQK